MSFESASAPHPDDTIVAVSSAAGPAPRAIVRLSGPRAKAVVGAVFLPSPLAGEGGGRFEPPGEGYAEQSRNCKALLTSISYPSPGGEAPPPSPARGEGRKTSARRFARGALRLTGVHSPLPATLYFFAAPRSYTGQDVAELHLVGSPPLVERLVADLLAAGARPARPGEFTMRAFLAGKKDLPQAEAVQAVIDAGTDADLGAALAQLAGGVSRPLDALRDDLLNLLADTEAALDFADEDIEFVGQTESIRQFDVAIAKLSAVAAQMESRTVSGRAVRVALVGAPNAGKSSLFNALTGGTALVSAIPGTTRDYLTRPLALSGVACELIDTAGWQDATDTIEAQAQRLGAEQSARADVVVWCDEHAAFAAVDEARLTATGAAVLKVRTKSDLASGGREPPDGEPLTSLESPSGGSRPPLACSVHDLGALRGALADVVVALARPALAPSQSRCRHHVLACLERLREARTLTAAAEPPELVALALRGAIDALGEMTGAVYTNDLLDRVFSRFCIGK